MNAILVYDLWRVNLKEYRIGAAGGTFRLMEEDGEFKRRRWRFIDKMPAKKTIEEAIRDAEMFATFHCLWRCEIINRPIWKTYTYPNGTTCYLARCEDGKFRLMEREHKMFARAFAVESDRFPACDDFLDAVGKADAFAAKKPYLVPSF